jgi:hypothetical protein
MHEPKRGRRLRRPSILVAAALVAGAGLAIVPTTTALAGPPPTSLCPGADLTQFGPNVCVFNNGMSQATIQTDLDNIADQQVPNQFGSQRYSLFFDPGTYGTSADPLAFQLGFYTQLAGLGDMPEDVVINGEVLVLNQCTTPDGPGPCEGTDNFWRSISNLTLNVMVPTSTIGATSPASGDGGGPGCDVSTELYAASQAMPIRRVLINGSLTLQDYCDQGFVSGGFIADSEITGSANFYGQQQYFVRNSNIGGSSNSVWNMVFSGVNGAPATQFGPTVAPSAYVPNVTPTPVQYTSLPTSPVTEEEPFLYTTINGNYRVFVPAVQDNSSGPAWADGTEAGTSLSISKFFIANPSTPVAQINFALLAGKNLILTPGVYDLSQPIVVSRPDTVVMGQGFATLLPTNGNSAMIIASNNGVKLSDVIIDAGPINSNALLTAGSAGGTANAADPDLFSDVFFRIGGAESPAHANFSFIDEASNSIIDDMWAWRADHGTTATSTGWTVNTGSTGLVVTGNDVTAYGLAVEHYQQNEVIWSGQGGTVVFFQNENPYDVPSQAAWMETPTQDGYPAFLVPNNVTTFHGYGMGSYSFFNVAGITPPIQNAEAFEAPNTAGVQFSNIFTIFLSTAGFGGINSVIDGVGYSTTITNPDYPEDACSPGMPCA